MKKLLERCFKLNWFITSIILNVDIICFILNKFSTIVIPQNFIDKMAKIILYNIFIGIVMFIVAWGYYYVQMKNNKRNE